MDFTPSEFWKNFRLGSELSISGNFIYNGLYSFDLMEHFYYEEEAFDFLYNISVGIERIQKICIILLEHNEEIDQTTFEESLITHNHNDLHNRITKHKSINLGKSHNKLIALLTKFYKSARYEKFQFESVYKKDFCKSELIKFIEDSLSIEISTDMIGCTSNSQRIKKFIGRTIGKLCTEYYQIVRDECHRLNIYTYEISYHSKAFKIFIAKKFDFFDERVVQQEILKFLIQRDLPSPFNEFINSFDPLELESFHVNHYINYLFSFHKNYNISSEVTELYSEIDNIKSRLEYLDLIGHSDAYFEDEE